MRVLKIKILDCKAKYKQLKQIEELLSSDEIDNNGNIVIKCDIEADIEPLRKEISLILDIDTMSIEITNVDESRVIKHEDLIQQYRIKR